MGVKEDLCMQTRSTDKASIEAYIKASIKHGRTQQSTIAFAKFESEDFGQAVAAAFLKGVPKPTLGRIHVEIQKIRREKLEEAGIEPVRITERDVRMQNAIETLIRRIGDGRPLSAFAAASESGLDRRQSSKLAYRIPVMRGTVKAGIDRQRDSLFVQRLFKDDGMTDLVVNTHASLSKLASTLTNVQRSLVGHANQLEAVGMQFAAEQRGRTADLSPSTKAGNSRGAWHAQAVELWRQGRTGNQIARLLGRSLNAVEKALRRKRPEQRA